MVGKFIEYNNPENSSFVIVHHTGRPQDYLVITHNKNAHHMQETVMKNGIPLKAYQVFDFHGNPCYERSLANGYNSPYPTGRDLIDRGLLPARFFDNYDHTNPAHFQRLLGAIHQLNES